MTLLAALILLQAQGPEPFTGDERLNRLISYSTPTTSVREVLEHIKTETGAELRVLPAIAEDLVVLRVKQRPAYEVLSKIARHFDWVWTKGELGYTLGGKPGWEARERQQIEDAVFKAMSGQVEQAKEVLRKAGTIDRRASLARLEQIAAEAAAIEKANEDREEYDEADLKRLRALKVEEHQLKEPIDPANLLVSQILSTMSRATLLELANRGRLVFSVHPTAAQKAMSGGAVRMAEQLVAEVVRATQRYYAGQDSDWGPGLVKPSYAKYAPGDVAAVRVSISGDRAQILAAGQWDSASSIEILSKSGRVVWGHSPHLGSGFSQSYYDEYDYEEGIEEGQEEPQKPDPLGPVDLFPQKLSDLPAVREAIGEMSSMDMPPLLLLESMKKDSKVDPLAYRNQIAVLLAEAADCSLIADAYDGNRSSSYVPRGETIGEALDSFARQAGSKWQFEDGWVAARSERPAVGRATTVPRSVFRRYRDLMADQLGLTADQFAEMTLELTDLHFHSEVVETFMMIALPIGWTNSSDATRFALRAWASLTPAHKAALRAGETLAFGSLPIAAKNYFGEFLYRLADQWQYEVSVSTVNQLLDGSLGSDGEDEDQTDDLEVPPDFDEDSYVGDEDVEITQILPLGLSGDARLSLELFSKPAISTEFEMAGRKLPVTFPAAFFGELKLMLEGDLGSEFPMPPVSFTGFKPADASGAIMSLTFLPEKRATAALVGMVARPNTTFGQMEELPAEIREAVDKAYARAKKRFERYRDWGGGGGRPERN